MSSQMSSISVIQTQDLSVSALNLQRQNNSTPSSSPISGNHLNTNGLPLISQNAIHRSPDSPQPELATMTNVNVLDLQTGDKEAVYIYESPKMLNLDSNSEHQVILDHLQSSDTTSNVAITPSTSNQPLAKIEFDENQIIRVVGPNGEQQQIISREIINGEHHILSRNEAGEHILTRIVSDPTKLIPNENSAALTAATMFEQSQKLNEHSFEGDSMDPSMLESQYDPAQTVELKSNENDKQIDLIYNDGNKTVIYTTTDQKSLELYQSGDLSGLVSTNSPIVVQGGLQYSSEQSSSGQGQSLFIVADSSIHTVEGHLHTR